MKSLLLLLLPAVLGTNPYNVCTVNYRILGGEVADKDDFPGLVFIEKIISVHDQNLKGMCAGSLIADRWVLTAAHCLLVEPPGQLMSIRVHPAKEDPRYIESGDFIIHDEYRNYRNDIALIRLPASMFTIDSDAKIMPLPAQDQWLTSNEVTLVGWGVTSISKELDFPQHLQKLEHVPIDQTICLRKGVSPAKYLCRYPTLATGTTCPGDSGGPIFMDGLQVGIVSHTEPNALSFLFPRTLQIDTRVSGYRYWIDEKIKLYTY